MNLADTRVTIDTDALALEHDEALPARPGAFARTTRSLRARVDGPNALRLCGATLLALSLSRFLLAGVAVDNDLQRFALLLVQTAAFTATGFALARWLDDRRGARLLFGVALASVPAGFTVLGAMIYSLVPVELFADPASVLVPGAARELPGFARWQLASARDIAVAAGATLVVLVPSTFFGFATLARRSSVRLGATLLACSTLLLVPVREPALAGALVLASGALALWTWRALAGTDDALVTLEGRFAQALLAVPAGIVAVRAMVADDPGPAFAAMLGLLTLLGARAAMRASGPDSRAHLGLFPLAGLAILAAMPGLLEMLGTVLPSGADLIVAAALGGALIVELARHSHADRISRMVEAAWGMPLLGLAVLGNLLGEHGIVVTVSCAVLVLVMAVVRRRRSLGACALLALLWPFASVLAEASDWFLAHRWEGLAVLGIAVIVGAGVVQRHGLPTWPGRRAASESQSVNAVIAPLDVSSSWSEVSNSATPRPARAASSAEA